jgi:hypothetical protein
MREGPWSQALEELVDTTVAAFVRFWKQDIVQVALVVGMFLALAAPILLLILVLWYVDSTGWRPAGGFYKIGEAPGSPLSPASPVVAGLCLIVTDARSHVARVRSTRSPPFK